MVPDRRSKFLKAVLGDDGAHALTKATERSAELGYALVPRTIMAWLHTARGEFEGEVPGVENTYVSFTKAEAGYTGSISIDDDLYKFADASEFRLIAAIAVALDLDQARGDVKPRDLDLERLGKSIDILAKAKMLTRELVKKSPSAKGKDQNKEEESPDGGSSPEMEKAAAGPGPEPAPGRAHAPTSPKMPTPPTKVQPPAPKPKGTIRKPHTSTPAKPVASYTVKLSQSETGRLCLECGLPQFKNGVFAGCMCFRELAKASKVVLVETDGVTLELPGDAWDEDALSTLFEAVGRR
jgi:hypothetical protein